MLNALRMLGDDLREKARWYYASDDPASIAKAAVADGTLATVLYRLMQGSRDAGLTPLEMLFNKANTLLNGCVIGRGAEFGPGFVIIHPNGIVINGKARGGANVHVEHQVTIGDDGEGRCGSLGDDVYIGAGAKIIGPVTVGDGARIGANAVVVRDVEPLTTVVGIPAKAVRRRTPEGEAEVIATPANGAASEPAQAAAPPHRTRSEKRRARATATEHRSPPSPSTKKTSGQTR
jgi:serine O-acetyltransferase